MNPQGLTNVDVTRGNPRDGFHIDSEKDPNNLVLTIGGRSIKLPYFPQKASREDDELSSVPMTKLPKLEARLEGIATSPDIQTRMDEKILARKLRLQQFRASPYPSRPLASGNGSISNMASDPEKSQLMVAGFPAIAKPTRSNMPLPASTTQDYHQGMAGNTKSNAHRFRPIQPRPTGDAPPNRSRSAGDAVPQHYYATLPASMNPPIDGVVFPPHPGLIDLGPANMSPLIHGNEFSHVGTVLPQHRFFQALTRTPTTNVRPPLPVFGTGNVPQTPAFVIPPAGTYPTGVPQHPMPDVPPVSIPRAETVVPVPVAATQFCQDTSSNVAIPGVVTPPVGQASMPQNLEFLHPLQTVRSR